MPSKGLLKRQQRIVMRNKLIKQDHCPNCSIHLRERMRGGMYCSKCNWEVRAIKKN